MKLIESRTFLIVKNFIIIFCNSLLVFSSNKTIKKLINKSLILNPGPDIRESLNKISLSKDTNVLNVNKVISLCLTFDNSFFILYNNSFLFP